MSIEFWREMGRFSLEPPERLELARFVVQRADCDFVEPADDIDPAYGAALRSAVAEGVEVLAVGARVTARAIFLTRMLPVHL